MPLILESMMRRRLRIRREPRMRLVNFGKKVCWVTDAYGVQQ